MAYHLCRDFNPESTGYVINKSHVTYLYPLSVFLYRVLGFSLVGQTNWNINSSPFLISSGLVSGSNGAGINFGVGFTYEVSIPPGVRAVVNAAAPTGDIGRMLVLRSTDNPTKNSGCFKVTGVNITNNRLIIAYRSTDTPPVENANSMDWWLYESETTISSTFNNDGGAGPTYTGGGVGATNSRIILQSPHNSAWQVRIAAEPILTENSLCNVTVTTGYGGNSSGDFALTGPHTHVAQYQNLMPTGTYLHSIPGGGNNDAPSRMNIAGDDTGQAVIVAWRQMGESDNNGINILGIPDNEPEVLSNTDRVFTYGRGTAGNGQGTSTIMIRSNSTIGNVGVTNKKGIPTLCSLVGWAYLDGTSALSPIHSSNAGDCPFTLTTEILPIEIWSGISNDLSSASTSVIGNFFPINQTYMGTVPFIRLGRANFGAFTTTTDGSKSWIHLQNGIYLQWGGPTVI